jgi:tetratricopeptide (TPR) repeat protein
MALLIVGRLADAQAELHKALEFGESQGDPGAYLAMIYARQEKWAEALHFAEKASPMNPGNVGILAGVLKRMGQENRAEELIQRLMPGEAYGAPCGLSFFYFVCGELDRAAEWWEKVIEQRFPAIQLTALICSRSNPRWPRIAELMNLPEDSR